MEFTVDTIWLYSYYLIGAILSGIFAFVTRGDCTKTDIFAMIFAWPVFMFFGGLFYSLHLYYAYKERKK